MREVRVVALPLVLLLALSSGGFAAGMAEAAGAMHPRGTVRSQQGVSEAVQATIGAAQEDRAQEERVPDMPSPEDTYLMPAPRIQEILGADKNYATLDQLSPDGDHFLVPLQTELSTLERKARRTLRLASLEIRPQTNRTWGLDTYGTYGLRIHSLSGRSFTDVRLPDDVFVSDVVWSPDGDRIAFLAHLDAATQVWVADAGTGRAEALSEAPVMATIAAGFPERAAGSDMLQWTPQGTLITLLVPPDRGPEPEENPVPVGPIVRRTRDGETSTRTIPFLLEDEHDAALFEHYTTSRIAELAPGRQPRFISEPGIYTSMSLSPDGRHLIVARIERPFSFITSYSGFPSRTEIVRLRDGAVVSTLLERELREGGGGRGGDGGDNEPRQIEWRPDGKGLSFVQRQPRQGGDEAAEPAAGGAQGRGRGGRGGAGPGEQNDRKDRIMLAAAPFDLEEAQVVAESDGSLSGVAYSRDGSWVFASRSDGGDRSLVAWRLDPSGLAAGGPATEPTVVVEEYGPSDPLELPGDLVTRRTGNGRGYALVSSDGATVYLEGPGYEEDFTPRPFVDEVEIATGEKRRVFQSAEDSFDRPLAPLDADLARMVVSRESKTDFPDSFLWGRDGDWENLTNNVDPFPDVTAARRIDFTFTRRDGVEIEGRISMPVGWRQGERVPAMFWTYPREYDDVEAYERATLRSRNHNAFTEMSLLRWSDIWLTQGYALVYPDIPIIGEPYNDKFIPHLVDTLYAAIRELDRMGLIDPDRIGHGGHSYGAFATANILAHAPYFKAGIAGDGAYNRSLTPAGFQSERRDIWEAPHVYVEMSPFFAADQIDTPLLMYHGADDDNSGTWPIQSRRMIHALTALGKTAVLYEYPYESHTPRAIENKMDMWRRFIDWFDFYVKGDGAGDRLTEGQGRE